MSALVVRCPASSRFCSEETHSALCSRLSSRAPGASAHEFGDQVVARLGVAAAHVAVHPVLKPRDLLCGRGLVLGRHRAKRQLGSTVAAAHRRRHVLGLQPQQVPDHLSGQPARQALHQ
ncbi:hypothetical protein ACFQZ2_23365, partial [Streptomonospora algeriensis]